MASAIMLYGLFGHQYKASVASWLYEVQFSKTRRAIIAKGNKIEGIGAIE